MLVQSFEFYGQHQIPKRWMNTVTCIWAVALRYVFATLSSNDYESGAKKFTKLCLLAPHSASKAKLYDLTKLNYEPWLEAHYSPGQRQFGTAVKSRSQNF